MTWTMSLIDYHGCCSGYLLPKTEIDLTFTLGAVSNKSHHNGCIDDDMYYYCNYFALFVVKKYAVDSKGPF